jgi:hypothetical protein
MPALPPISRRSLLRGAAVISAYVFSASGSPSTAGRPGSAAASSGPVVNADQLTLATNKFFDPGWTSQGIASFPVRVPLLPRTGDLAVTARWDPRLFAFHPPVYATGGAVLEIDPTTLAAGQLDFPLADDVTEIGLQVEALATYPDDALADVIATAVTFHDSEGKTADELVLQPTSTACAPWSIEVTVDWVCHGAVIIPAAISILSRGPHPAPAGLVFSVQYADSAGTPSLAADDEEPAATLTANPSSGFVDLTIATTRPLDPDGAVEVSFPVDVSDSKPQAFGEIVPRLQLTIPDDTVGMRESGRLSSFPVTASGSLESTYLAAPTA